MGKSLIIVESPAKTKTLKNFLDGEYLIEASMGHVRDLPERKLGVDVEHDFEPTYQALSDRKDVLKKLQDAAKKADTVYLASDPDREGEAIAWHLAQALNLKNPLRIQFNEITKQAVQDALGRPREVDMDRVNAQQARRVLDRLIGYKLSPVLSAKIQKGLSAGRVQSVALRLICEREREVLAFIPEEYWSLTASLTHQPPAKQVPFTAKLHSRGGARLEPKTIDDIQGILRDLGLDAENTEQLPLNGRELPPTSYASYTIQKVTKREQKRNPSAPFITSTLQQEAARKLGFSNRRTMSVAQQLYEGIELASEGSVGLITYMRTDSVRVANEAQQEARTYIEEKFGKPYLQAKPQQFKSKGAAQDAHEAIRPTSAFRDPDTVASFLDRDQNRLYRLIWQRFIASQMNPALLDVTTAEIAAASPATGTSPYIFRAAGSVMRFDGFLRVYREGKDEETEDDDEQPSLPPLIEGETLDLRHMLPKQHYTDPPPRYTEATIVKALEERGIGRPSTYASIISVLRDRKYVELREKKFFPTDLGFVVCDQLVKHFPDVMNIQFTAEMETKLDSVEEGTQEWVGLIRDFYTPFEQAIEAARTGMESLKPAPVETEYHCPVTDKVMLLRTGRFGQFISCSGYPECKKILKLDASGAPVEGINFSCGLEPKEEVATTERQPSILPDGTSFVCPEGNGVMIQRTGRFGTFLGCSAYPKCRTTLKLDQNAALIDGQEFKCTLGQSASKAKAKTSTTTRKTAAKRKTTDTA